LLDEMQLKRRTDRPALLRLCRDQLHLRTPVGSDQFHSVVFVADHDLCPVILEELHVEQSRSLRDSYCVIPGGAEQVRRVVALFRAHDTHRCRVLDMMKALDPSQEEGKECFVYASAMLDGLFHQMFLAVFGNEQD